MSDDDTQDLPEGLEVKAITSKKLINILSALSDTQSSGIKALLVDQEAPPQKIFNPEIVYNVNHSLIQANFGEWGYDADTNIITIEIAPHISHVQLNTPLINAYLERGMPLNPNVEEYLLDYTTDVTRCSTCVHFSPSAAMIDAGAEQVPNWPFNRAKKTPQCSNIELVGKDNFDLCGVYPHFHNCGGYTVSDWSDIVGAYVDNSCVLTVQRRYFGTRIPKYRVKDTVYEDRNEAMASFDALVGELSEAGSEVSVADLDITSRNHLFNTILV